MRCNACEGVISKESLFCSYCGQDQGASSMSNPETPESELNMEGLAKAPSDSELYNCTDGIMRWVYELNMWKNPTIMITSAKAFFLAALVPAVLVGAITFFEDGFMEAARVFSMVAGIVMAIMAVLLVLAYPLTAIINGGKYCVLFEMDDTGVKHNHLEKDVKRSQAVTFLCVAAGLASGNLGVAGAGILSNVKKSSYSNFSKVRKIVVNRKRGVIYLNEAVGKNQVYASKENFDTVLDHIVARCKKAEIKKV